MSELERQFVGKLTDPTEIARAHLLGVRSEYFEESVCSSIWQFCLKYWEDSGSTAAPSAWAIEQEFHGITVEPGEDTIDYLAEKLRLRYATNQLQEMIIDVANETNVDPVGALKKLQNESSRASENLVKRVTRLNMADTVAERRAEYGKRKECGGMMGAPYGLELLDAHTGGLVPGELAIVGAAAKTGKTMFLLHVATNAIKEGYRVMVVSLEMSLKEIQNRLDAMYSGVSYDRLLPGTLTPQEEYTLYDAQESLAEIGGIQIEMPEPGDRTVSSIVSRARQYGATYLFIDQLSHMEPGVRVNNLKEHHATIVQGLSTAISTPGAEIPCMLAAQMRRGDEELTQESFANAAEIEREADIMFGLSRNRDLRDNHAMRLDILGSRRSDTGSFLLQWELQARTEIKTLDRIRL